MKCQHDGCDLEGEECTIHNEQGEEVLDGHYCGNHAAAHGFCPMCGQFWGGISSFEMNGVCDHCHDELASDEDGMDDGFDNYEPVGSCDNCDWDYYAEEDDGSGLCDQCQWHAAGCPQPGEQPAEELDS